MRLGGGVCQEENMREDGEYFFPSKDDKGEGGGNIIRGILYIN